MRYRCPDECTGVTHAGAPLLKDADGLIEAAEDAVAALAPHGIVPAGEDEGPGRGVARRHRTDDRRMLR